MFTVIEQVKQCRDCGEMLPLSAFHRRKRSSDGASSYCRPCTAVRNRSYVKSNRARHNELSKQWVQDNPEKRREVVRRNKLAAKYGITLEQYDDMLYLQRGRCAICLQPFASSKLTHVDHNHKTGQVRGLLCYNCNLMLGHALEERGTLLAAIRYLDHYSRLYHLEQQAGLR